MKRLLLYLIVILLCMIFVVPASAGRIQSWFDVPQEAISKDGLARVLVLFEVPELDVLTRASSSAKDVGARSQIKSASKEMVEADAALNKAISIAGNQILKRLGSRTKRGKPAYSINRRFDYLPLLAMELSPETLQALQADPQVKRIFVDLPTPLPQLPPVETDPAEDLEDEPLSTIDVMNLIGADKAWAKGYTGRGWHVAILDTGIRSSHEFFRGKDITEACFSSRGNCPNGTSSMTGPGAAAHLSDDHAVYDHGTHVAGTAAGLSPDGMLTGVAKDAGIIAVNIFSSFSPEECDSEDPCVMSYSSDQISALLHIYSLRNSYNIGAINMSLGGGRYDDYCDEEDNYPSFMALDLLRKADIPTSISSGNGALCGNVGSPACISSGITVMASTRTDMEVKFSNWHSKLGDIFAPGQKIVSAVGSGDSDYEEWNGTSMAAPHVAGAMTLMRQVRPFDSPEEILFRLTERGASITTPCPDGGNQKRLFVDNFHTPREKADMLFNKLESQYPEILYPRPATTQVEDGYIYRYYTGKNVYLATYQENAFFVDEHGNIVELGSVDHLVYHQ